LSGFIDVAAMNPFTKRLVELLPNQFHAKAVEVDSHLRVEGAPSGTVYAIGDAATVRTLGLTVTDVGQIETNLVDHLMELFEKFDRNKDNKMFVARFV
jgi:NADH dehydrogenase FAD-containing subunit